MLRYACAHFCLELPHSLLGRHLLIAFCWTSLLTFGEMEGDGLTIFFLNNVSEEFWFLAGKEAR